MDVVMEVVLVTGVGLLVAGLVAMTWRLTGLNQGGSRASGPVRDDEELRKALRAWEPLVVRTRGTFRDVKRFANRARLFAGVSDRADGDITVDALVGFIALEECGAVDPESVRFDFERWRNARVGEGFLPGEWAGKVGQREWDAYRALVRGERVSDGRASEEVAAQG